MNFHLSFIILIQGLNKYSVSLSFRIFLFESEKEKKYQNSPLIINDDLLIFDPA